MNAETIRAQFPIGAKFLADGETRVRVVEKHADTFDGAPDALILVHEESGFWPSECRGVRASDEQPTTETFSEANQNTTTAAATLRAQLAEISARDRIRQQREEQLEIERQALSDLRQRERTLAERREASLQERLDQERAARRALTQQLAQEGKENILAAIAETARQLSLAEHTFQQGLRQVQQIQTSLRRMIVVPADELGTPPVENEDTLFPTTRKLGIPALSERKEESE
jgi:hypothetical protein